MSDRSFSDHWNFWTVKYLRQLRHSKIVLLGLVAFGIIQFLIIQYLFTTKNYSPSWPWAVPYMLVFCGIGTTFFMAIGFAHHIVTKTGKQPGLLHFVEFSPVEEGTVFRGLIYSFLLTFGGLLVACLPIWVLAVIYFPLQIHMMFFYTLIACFLTLFVFQPDFQRWLRLDMIASVVILGGWFAWLEQVTVGMAVVLLGILAAWQMVNYRESLRFQNEVSEVLPRIGQALLLLLGWGLLHYGLTFPILVLVGTFGAYASMGRALFSTPARQLEMLPKASIGRLAAFLLYGNSAGGWLWSWFMAICGWQLLMLFHDVEFWGFVFSWGLVWAEISFLLNRRLASRMPRSKVAMLYHLVIAIGLIVTGITVALIVISSGRHGEMLFRESAFVGWITAGILFFPFLFRIGRDWKIFLRGRAA